MQWLSQNWMWLALGAAFVLLMMRRGGAGGSCCGGLHAGPAKTSAPQPAPSQDEPAPRSGSRS